MVIIYVAKAVNVDTKYKYVILRWQNRKRTWYKERIIHVHFRDGFRWNLLAHNLSVLKSLSVGFQTFLTTNNNNW